MSDGVSYLGAELEGALMAEESFDLIRLEGGGNSVILRIAGAEADIAMLRSESAVFGLVASDPTVSRLIDVLAASGEKALDAVRLARSEVPGSGPWLATVPRMRAPR